MPALGSSGDKQLLHRVRMSHHTFITRLMLKRTSLYGEYGIYFPSSVCPKGQLPEHGGGDSLPSPPLPTPAGTVSSHGAGAGAGAGAMTAVLSLLESGQVCLS